MTKPETSEAREERLAKNQVIFRRMNKATEQKALEMGGLEEYQQLTSREGNSVVYQYEVFTVAEDAYVPECAVLAAVRRRLRSRISIAARSTSSSGGSPAARRA